VPAAPAVERVVERAVLVCGTRGTLAHGDGRPVRGTRVDTVRSMDVTPTDLLGTWRLEREVEDRLAGDRRTVTGTTVLEPVEPGRVRWHEEGVMRWSGHEVPVQRTLWVVREDAGWAVRFEDGRPFHPWAVGEPVEHPCGPDHYTGLIEAVPVDATAPAFWRVEWRARGPQKDYVMRTVLRRAD